MSLPDKHFGNMYGCTDCPKCGRPYRCVFNDRPRVMQCDDCGFDEPITEENYYYYKPEEKMSYGRIPNCT